MHLISLTSESGITLNHTELRVRADAFVLISGQCDRAGSIFGPYPISSARFIADQAQASDQPFALLSEFDSTRTAQALRQDRTLISRRF